ncbi:MULTISPECIES: hypothetical protein [unclassified Streptomyces]|uniref:hypothetical protein n=1 Tax=unclassified Streptomyces TaxID=2593676 RepID=UPI00037B9CA5|nr:MULTISPECIES: hypothetical protein [unclassified Streptomyces]MYS36389.1 hypothetical protein [Streptomyces sp. SID4920]MYX67272.1 hypothetical protein [Streptomyces sp. SID8373]
MATQNYSAEINIRTADGELITLYPDITGPVGMSAAQLRAAAEKAALAQEPGGRVEGSRVSTDGIVR